MATTRHGGPKHTRTQTDFASVSNDDYFGTLGNDRQFCVSFFPFIQKQNYMYLWVQVDCNSIGKVKKKKK